MGGIFGALGQGLQGLQQGLFAREGLKQQQFENQQTLLENDQRALEMRMRQREHELVLKELGLKLEQAEYDRDIRLAMGTPAEVVNRQFERDNQLAQQEAEDRLLRNQKTQSEIDENKAHAKYYEQGGGRAGPKEEDPAKEFEELLKMIDGGIRAQDDIITDPESTPEEKAYAQRQKIKLINQRETAYNSYVTNKGFPITEFGIGEAPPPDDTTTAPAESQGLLGRIMGASQGVLDQASAASQGPAISPQAPKLAGDVPDFFKLRPGQSVNPAKGLGALLGLAQAGMNVIPKPWVPIQQIAGTNQNVSLENFTPEMIEKMKQMGLLQTRTR